MKKFVFLVSLSATVYASSNYVPFSKFSQNEKATYNFNKVAKVIEEKEVVKKMDIIAYNEKIPSTFIKQSEVRQPILNNTANNFNYSGYKEDTRYSAKLIYSPLTSKYSSVTNNGSTTTNTIQPEVSIKLDKHTIKANYFRNEIKFASNTIDTSWIKLAYRYQYNYANIGMNANYVKIDNNSRNMKEFFPSFAVDFKNRANNLDFKYGVSVGKNSNIDYSYEYFFNVDVQTPVTNKASLLVGYKNKTIKLDSNDEKHEFKGPFIGVSTKF